MPKSANQKLKLLYLLKIFHEKQMKAIAFPQQSWQESFLHMTSGLREKAFMMM